MRGMGGDAGNAGVAGDAGATPVARPARAAKAPQNTQSPNWAFGGTKNQPILSDFPATRRCARVSRAKTAIFGAKIGILVVPGGGLSPNGGGSFCRAAGKLYQTPPADLVTGY